jgi:hypothetical protein
MAEANKTEGLTGIVRQFGPALAFVAGLLVIPLKLAQLVSTRQWSFDLANLRAAIQQIDAAGWISIALIFVEGLLAGAVFMFAVSYSLTFQQNIGKIGDDVTNEIGRVGDDIINVLTSSPPPILVPPSDSITVDEKTKSWIDGMLEEAAKQSAQQSDALQTEVAALKAALRAANAELDAERAAKAQLSSQLESLSNEMSGIYGKSMKQEEVIELLKPLIRGLKQLGAQASRLDPDASSDDAAPVGPSLQ